MGEVKPSGATIDEILRFLNQGLGRLLLAQTIGVSRHTLANSCRRSSSPSLRSRERFSGALLVSNVLAEVEAPETVRVWFMGLKDALNDYTPAEVIALGRIEDVAAVARAYVQRS